MSEKKPNAFAKFKAACRRARESRDQRDAALKVAAAALATLEATQLSDTMTQGDFDAAEIVYEDKVVALIELNTRMSAACDEFSREHSALLARCQP